MQTLPVLMYHHVSPQPGLVTVDPQTFCAQLSWLTRHDYHSVTSDDLAAFFAGRRLPEKSVLITFDDGYLDNSVYAYPLLREFGLHPLLFLITGANGSAAQC